MIRPATSDEYPAKAPLSMKEGSYLMDELDHSTFFRDECPNLEGPAADGAPDGADESAYYKQCWLDAMDRCGELECQLGEARAAYNAILNSASWKLTRPARAAFDFVKGVLKRFRLGRLFCSGLKCLFEGGFRYAWRKVKEWFRDRLYFRSLGSRPLYSQEELDAQRIFKFPRAVKFSIVVPLFNTPEAFLRGMIRSVMDQTYGNWELCMADGSDGGHDYVGRICAEYVAGDGRITYQKLGANEGISGNTNRCLDMATGDYIALLDHDDILHPAALYDTMLVICGQDADLIYTDEAVFEGSDTRNIVTIHFKPNFAIDNLRANNYICHFTVFRKTLLDKVGRFRSVCDGSQDHDMMLRLTAFTDRIAHIPKVLYYWRSHPGSVAMDASVKTYASAAGIKAVQDSVAAFGYDAKVESSRIFPGIYRIRYGIKTRRKVSIVISTKDNAAGLTRCVESVLGASTYSNYEIVIVDGGSADPKTSVYYDILSRDPRIRVFFKDDGSVRADLNNFGAEMAEGSYCVFLDDSVEVVTPEWIEELLMYVQRDDVAAAGAMIYDRDGLIWHAGMILGFGPDHTVGYAFRGVSCKEVGYMGRLGYAQNLSVVSAACMMVKRSVFLTCGGFDAGFTGSCGDADLCLRFRKAGYHIVWTPYAELCLRTPCGYMPLIGGAERSAGDISRFRDRWAEELAAGDPYYNPNFALERECFSFMRQGSRV